MTVLDRAGKPLATPPVEQHWPARRLRPRPGFRVLVVEEEFCHARHLGRLADRAAGSERAVRRHGPGPGGVSVVELAPDFWQRWTITVRLAWFCRARISVGCASRRCCAALP